MLRLATVGDILFWTTSDVLKVGEECVLGCIQIPRLGLTFVPRITHDKSGAEMVSFASDELGGMTLCMDMTPLSEPGLQEHLSGLRHGVWLRNAEMEYQLLMPLMTTALMTMSKNNVRHAARRQGEKAAVDPLVAYSG